MASVLTRAMPRLRTSRAGGVQLGTIARHCDGAGMIRRGAGSEEIRRGQPSEGRRRSGTSEIEWANQKLAMLLEQQRRMAAELMEREERNRLVFAQSRDAMMILEPPSWRSTSGNPAICNMFGVDNISSFVELDPWRLSPEHQPGGRRSSEMALEIERAMSNGSHFFEWTHRRLGGEPFSATVLLTRIEMAGKVFLHATVRDITEQKRAEQILLDSGKRARRQRMAIATLAFEHAVTGGDAEEAARRITRMLTEAMSAVRPVSGCFPRTVRSFAVCRCTIPVRNAKVRGKSWMRI